jgi:hypothetical protein
VGQCVPSLHLYTWSPTFPSRVIPGNLFRTYFYKRRKEGLPYKKVVLATAHKLIRVIFVMLSRKTYFVEGGIKYS